VRKPKRAHRTLKIKQRKKEEPVISLRKLEEEKQNSKKSVTDVRDVGNELRALKLI
jgi:hypothetical protein